MRPGLRPQECMWGATNNPSTRPQEATKATGDTTRPAAARVYVGSHEQLEPYSSGMHAYLSAIKNVFSRRPPCGRQVRQGLSGLFEYGWFLRILLLTHLRIELIEFG